ncbi:MAG TPA: hypothetical protein VFF78_00930 [Anaerolineaceae bacterium]|nr:hypothetical protein [Anaerolineaceae bacterium]
MKMCLFKTPWWGFTLVLAVMLAAAGLGCQCSTNPTAGSIKALQNEVWKGPDTNSLSMVTDTPQDLHNGEVLRIQSGGEAMLDFQNQMIIHLYNDSQAKLISAHPDPNTPLDVRMRLEEGGLVGIVKDQGGQAVFETPGGGTIYITGTRFFMYYEVYNQYLLVGNFDGSASLEPAGGGAVYQIPKDSYILYQPGKDIIQMDIPDDLDVLTFMNDAAKGGMTRMGSQLIETALASPADIQLNLISIRPDELYIGDCPNTPDTTFVTAEVLSSQRLARVWLKWALNDEIGMTDMTQIQTGTFQGQIGPVTRDGTIYIYIYAEDGQGRIAELGPFTILVKICIG